MSAKFPTFYVRSLNFILSPKREMKQTCLLHFGPLPSYLRKSPLGHPAATNHFFSSKINPSLDPLNSSFTYVWPWAYSSNLVNWSRPICLIFVVCLVLWNITILEPSTHIHSLPGINIKTIHSRCVQEYYLWGNLSQMMKWSRPVCCISNEADRSTF